jgi:hypothetical protein
MTGAHVEPKLAKLYDATFYESYVATDAGDRLLRLTGIKSRGRLWQATYLPEVHYWPCRAAAQSRSQAN